MDRNIKNEMASGKKTAIAIMAIGILFALAGVLLYVKKDIWHIFPRMDIAWIGFCVVAVILFFSGIALLFISSNKQAWIDETDEMETAIAGKISMVGYAVQTTLLGIAFFLLTFMGYLNKASGFSIIAVILISGIILWIYALYLRTQGPDN